MNNPSAAHSPEFLAVALIVRPQGRKGEVLAEILTDFPERFERLRQVYLETPGERPEPANLERAWLHQGRVVLKLAGVDSIGQAETLRGRHLFLPYADRTQLNEGRYYVADLVGCRVVRRLPGWEQEIGLVTEVEATGGVDLLHVAVSGSKDGPDDEILIPLAAQICTSIDPVARLIVVDPPDDLLELNRQGRQG